MARVDSLLLVVMSCVTRQLEDLGSEVLYHSCKVDWNTSTDPLGIVAETEPLKDGSATSVTNLKVASFSLNFVTGDVSLLFGNPSELSLLDQICFVHLMFSVGACLVFVSSTEHKNGLLPSLAIHISVMTCDAYVVDHMVRFTSPPFFFCILQAIENWSRGRPG